MDYEIVGRPEYQIRKTNSVLLDELAKTLDTGDALRLPLPDKTKRGTYVHQLREGLKRRNLGFEWSRYGTTHIDVWAVPLNGKKP